MPIGPDFARQPREAEFDEIDALLTAAFGGAAEAGLVRSLRQEGRMFHEFVFTLRDPATNRSVIGAYAAMCRMVVPVNWFCLAPVAVRPEFQNGALAPSEGHRRHWRLGSRLVSLLVTPFLSRDGRMVPQSLLDPGSEEPPTLVVLGKPSFYSRCGFSQARAARLVTPYSLAHTLIARPGDDMPKARLAYPAAFDGV